MRCNRIKDGCDDEWEGFLVMGGGYFFMSLRVKLVAKGRLCKDIIFFVIHISMRKL